MVGLSVVGSVLALASGSGDESDGLSYMSCPGSSFGTTPSGFDASEAEAAGASLRMTSPAGTDPMSTAVRTSANAAFLA